MPKKTKERDQEPKWEVTLTENEIRLLRGALSSHFKKESVSPVGAKLYSLFSSILAY